MNKIDFNNNLKQLKKSYYENLERKFFLIFANQFTFEGDKDFDAQTQKLFFWTLWKYNYVAISKFGFGGGKYDKVVYIANPVKWDAHGGVSKAHGLIATRMFPTGDKVKPEEYTKTLDKEKDIIIQFDMITFKSPWYLIQPLLKEVAQNFVDISRAKNFSIPKFIWKNYNVEQSNIFNEAVNDLFDDEKMFIKLKGDDDKLTLSHTSFKKMEMTSPDNVSKIISNTKELLRLVFEIMGIKANISWKKERMVEAEIEQDNNQFFSTEKDFKNILNKFIEEYKRIYGVQLKLIDNNEVFNNENKENNNDLDEGIDYDSENV